MNDVKLLGHLAKDTEIKYLPTGTAVALVRLALNRSFKQNDEWKKETCFIDVKVWGRHAENCAALKKGEQLLVNGRLSQDTWEKDGKTCSKIYVTAVKVHTFGPVSKPAAAHEIPEAVRKEYEANDEELPF